MAPHNDQGTAPEEAAPQRSGQGASPASSAPPGRASTDALSRYGRTALALAAQGFPLFPAAPGGKVPLFPSAHPGGDPLRGVCRGECGRVGHGVHDATTDPARIRRWWAETPMANVALATGVTSGVIVLDVDPDKGGLTSLAALERAHGALPETLTVATPSGGHHRWFRHPGGRVANSASGVLGPGLDLRGDGGYVLVPPSGRGAGSYTVEVDALVRACPPWLAALVAAPHQGGEGGSVAPEGYDEVATDAYGAAALAAEAAQVAQAPEGRRNDHLNLAAFRLGQLVAGGHINPVEVAAELAAAAEANGVLAEDGAGQVAATIQSGLGAGVRHPRPDPSEQVPEDAGGGGDDADGWPEPLPLGAEVELPAFPVDALPGWLAEYVAAEAEATQTPPDLAGMLVLAALSTAAARRVEVEVRGGWWEPVNLFAVVAQEPGTRKSAVFRDVMAPLRAVEAELVAEAGPAVAEAAARKRIADQMAKGAEDKAAAGKATEDDAVAAAVRAALLEVPSSPRLLADDATPEALTSLLADQGGRMAVLSPEGGVFGILAGRYSRVPDLSVYLKGHAGDDLRVDRKGRPAEVVECPALTVGLAVQPGVLRRLAEHPEFRELGLLARFLYGLPPDLVGRRRQDAAPVPAEVRERFAAHLRQLTLDLYARDLMTLTLTPGAAEVLSSRMRELEPRLRLDDADGDLAHVRDWAAKLAGATVRIAALLHLAEHVGGDALPEAIEAAPLSRAARLADYLVPHALAAFDLMGGDPAVAGARYVLRRLRELNLRRFTGRELFRATARGRFPKVADLDPVLALLVEHDYLRRKDARPVGSKGGRPPSPVYLVHPRAW